MLLLTWIMVEDTTVLFWRRRGSRIRCWDAANLELLCEDWPRSKSRRGDNAEKRNPGRLGSATQALSEETEKNNQRPGLGKPLEQADGEKQLGRHSNHLQTRRINTHNSELSRSLAGKKPAGEQSPHTNGPCQHIFSCLSLYFKPEHQQLH